MAAYIFTLDNPNSLKKCITNGVYGTIFKNQPDKFWGIPQEGTLADYASMQEGDYVFFFIKRKIYGIGKLKNIKNTKTGIEDCKFLNFPNADIPKIYHSDKRRKNDTYIDHESYLNETDPRQRFICTFEPSPAFYEKGIDMDDALASKPHCFRILRAFWKLSFIKLDNEEAKCLFDVVLKDNHTHEKFKTNHNKFHEKIALKLNTNYLLHSKNILSHAIDSKVANKIKHEMALEAGLVDQIAKKDPDTIKIFSELQYLSHQVIASPFKPIDYMDKIDIFGYTFIPNSETVDKYYVIELKKDKANKDDIDQLLKYVDWVKDEYAGQNYSSIKAYLVAHDFTKDIHKHLINHGKRNYTLGRRPIVTDIWDDITLVKYSYDEISNKLKFSIIKI